MTDKERIEKLVQTLMHIKNCVSILKSYSTEEQVVNGADQVMRVIEFVIQANADQIKTPG